MNTFNVTVLNPQAFDLLQTLVKLNLISIEKEKSDELIDVVKRIRNRVENPPSLEEITSEVEKIRREMYVAAS